MTEAPNSPNALLQVQGLVKHFPITQSIVSRLRQQPQAVVRAVDGIDLRLDRAATLALVGESGCGKTTAGRCILYLQEPTAGKVTFLNEAIDPADSQAMRQRRKLMQIIFQDPNSSLNPRMTVGQTIGEALAFHEIVPKSERDQRVNDLLKTVGLGPQHRGRYPNELSGGQRQRIGIARALSVNPLLIVADEPVSALDVSIQAQILQLLRDLQDEFGISYLFISHDLGVVRHVSDDVAVMYLGKIVEAASTESLFVNPLHPYTRALLAAAPIANPRLRRQRMIISGDPPSPISPPSGCRFHTRCPYVRQECKETEPLLRELEPNHWVACHFAESF